MVLSLKKRVIFFFGVLLTGVVGVLGGYTRAHFSREGSLIASSARADTPLACGSPCDLRFWTQQQCDYYFCGVGGGDGCCSDASGAGACADACSGCGSDSCDSGGCSY